VYKNVRVGMMKNFIMELESLSSCQGCQLTLNAV